MKVVELFAGVGGFRLGFERVNEYKNLDMFIDSKFDTVFANQFEPSTNNQFAFKCYTNNFGSENVSNSDITTVKNEEIPRHDLLVGGFPCQDYSVAQSGAKGIKGKKGVLWWEIYRIAEHHKPKYILLENVDRLLKSPTNQRGRDFGVILFTLHRLGYNVEWRVINAADYGMPQRRRRVFIFASLNSTEYYTNMNKIISMDGFFAQSFPIQNPTDVITSKRIGQWKNPVNFSNKFKFDFKNSGYIINNKIVTLTTQPNYNGPSKLLRDCILNYDNEYTLPTNLYLTSSERKKNAQLKDGKRIERIKPNGDPYIYSEGSMKRYEPLDSPGRTMLTSEGTINRSSHFIEDPQTGRPRRIAPEEAELLNCFPQGWTDNVGMSNRQRYFCMGNALVVDLIEKMGEQIIRFNHDVNNRQ